MKKYFDVIKKSEFYSDITTKENIKFFLKKITKQLSKTKKIYIIGNGASCSMASHYATDFTKNCGIPAESLNDGALLTCFINDFNFKDSYMQMIKYKKISKDDFLIAISSSGNSQNIITAVNYCTKNKIPCLVLSGFNKTNLMNTSDAMYKIFSPGKTYGEVETAHNLFLHYIIDKLQK